MSLWGCLSFAYQEQERDEKRQRGDGVEEENNNNNVVKISLYKLKEEFDI